MQEEKNPNLEATESAVKTLVESKLDKIIEGAKTASEAIGDASDLIGNVAAQNNGGAVGDEVDKLVRGVKGIVEVVLKGVGDAEAGDNKKAEDGSTARDNNAAGKLFASDNARAAADAKKAAADAAKAVGGVSGADILQAMVKHNANNGNAGNSKKDAVIAGGMTLRGMTKGGKFAGPSDVDQGVVATIVKGAAISAVTKALDILTVAIRKTIDLGLKNVKEVIKINDNTTPVVSDKDASGVKNQ
ncbi:Variable outer membrane protein [Borrelia duttonii CR2A]|uniref:Variable large protein n=1 Tax=Borrelia duttonii CR2A TaxID=1432657 RepID=W6TF83_9SPIR|nr:Variable outer membrane protein [Borrelia duttonii CR2A]